jgi:hypothetical protein
MSFPRDSAFAQALEAARKAPVFQTPERIRSDQDARREVDAGFINIERYVLEDWVTELRDAHEGKRTAGFGMVVQIADEIQGYLER